jgi:hypothetical protein
MTNTTFICADGRFPVLKGLPVWLEKEVADKYPATFKIIREAIDLDLSGIAEEDAALVPEDVVPTEEPEVVALVEEEEVVALVEEEIDPGVKAMNDDIVNAVIDEAKELNEAEGVIAEDPEPNADVQADLIKLIDDIKGKKDLDVFAEERGVKLDRRKSLKSMQETLKETWKLN